MSPVLFSPGLIFVSRAWSLPILRVGSSHSRNIKLVWIIARDKQCQPYLCHQKWQRKKSNYTYSLTFMKWSNKRKKGQMFALIHAPINMKAFSFSAICFFFSGKNCIKKSIISHCNDKNAMNWVIDAPKSYFPCSRCCGKISPCPKDILSYSGICEY